jgi:2-dehydropantoate 2-reductase
MNHPQFAVVGAGPVGSIISAYLAHGGHDVAVIEVLPEVVERILADGVHVDGFAELHARIERAFVSIEAAAAAGARFDAVFVCVKGPINRLIAGALPSILKEDGVAVSFQNGLDTEAPLLAVCGPARTLRGAVNYAGVTSSPGRIRMTFFNGANYLGAAVPGTAVAEEKAKGLAALMTAAKMTTDFSSSVHRHVWAKAIRNSALMPISALTGQDMAEVMEFGASLDVLEHLLQEAIDVAASVGYEFDRKYYDDSLTYFRKAGHHMPSMYVDLQKGLQSEIGFLNHRIAEVGEKNGVPVTYNRAIANLVMCIDEVARTRKRAKP